MMQDSLLNTFILKLIELDNFLTSLCDNTKESEHALIDSNQYINKKEERSIYPRHLTNIKVKKRKAKNTNSKIDLVKLQIKSRDNEHIDKRRSNAIKMKQRRLRVSCDKLQKYKYFKTRRENIDKKLLRFMKTHIRESKTIQKTPFLTDFIENKFNVPYTNGCKIFSSVSYSYLRFLHSNWELSKVYKDLMVNHGEFVFDSLINNYQIVQIKDKESLKEYLTEYVDIYR